MPGRTARLTPPSNMAGPWRGLAEPFWGHRASMSQSSAFRRSARRAWARIASPVRPEQLRSVLGTLTQGTDTLLVHSSLSACGHLTDGPDDVVRALSQLCNTCCLPTFTYCYPS